MSTEAYWKSVEPFQLAFGTKVTVATLPLAGALSPMASATPFSNSVPLAGSDLITKWSTVPSTSLPLRTTGMAESSLPEADAAMVSGASLTGETSVKLSSAVLVSWPSETV
ncbi:hypothetical protein FQZ97_1263060 [compost metagenome]